MNIFSGLEKIVEKNYSLAKHTWYGLGGNADYFIRPCDIDQLKEIVKRCNENHINMRVMGFGSNLLISDDGVKAAVIKLEGGQFSRIRFENEHVIAAAGSELNEIVLACVKKGLTGIEMLTGIPGSLGGAIRMNAGGRFGDIGDTVSSVILMDKDGNIFDKSKPELMFEYRKTNITARFILEARMELSEANPEQVMKSLKETWIYKKNHQPLNTRNSGCIFKNPRGKSAGILIDKAGLKGLQIGGAVISEKHANFIVAESGCKSRDVRRLIQAVQERVQQQFGIELEPEIEIWD